MELWRCIIAIVSMVLRLFHLKEAGLDFFHSRLHSKCKTSFKTMMTRSCIATRVTERKSFSNSSLYFFLDSHSKVLGKHAGISWYRHCCCHLWWSWILALPLLSTSSSNTYTLRALYTLGHQPHSPPSHHPISQINWLNIRSVNFGQEWLELSQG